MGVLTDCTLNSEFVGGLKIANLYLPSHVKNYSRDGIAFRHIDYISKAAEKDKKIAATFSQAYATSHNLHYDAHGFVFDKPVMTILSKNRNWYPAELHSNKITMLRGAEGSDKESAINNAREIAAEMGFDFSAALGSKLVAFKINSQMLETLTQALNGLSS